MTIIVAAAIQQEGKTFSVPSPGRHHDVIRQMVQQHGVEPPIYGRQGFLTHDGEFLGREEARALAVANGQCPEPPHARLLFSEDLW